jgi:hypothetical protein
MTEYPLTDKEVREMGQRIRDLLFRTKFCGMHIYTHPVTKESKCTKCGRVKR